jgi:hypothetical protein
VTGNGFSEHDPDGQAIRAAAGLGHYSRTGWRRWLVPAVLVLVALSAVALVVAFLAH